MIDYGILMRALDYYQKDCGYQYIDVPWFVEPSTDAITRPEIAQPCLFKGKAFVGSAEQSFLQLFRDNKILPNKNYVAMTPCIRDDVNDKSHEMGFMKIELFNFYEGEESEIHFSRNYEHSLDDMLYDSHAFFSMYANTRLNLVKTSVGNFDINNNGIEVGSYSVKKMEIDNRHVMWVCGTGLAEPRFSYSLRNYNALN